MFITALSAFGLYVFLHYMTAKAVDGYDDRFVVEREPRPN